MTASILQDLTANLAPLSLAELPRDIELLERYDTKLAGPVHALRDLVDLLGREVRVLEVGGIRVARVRTNYFDTPETSLFRDHAQRRRRRYKVRIRRYDGSDEGFLEVKAKTNRRQTVKYRTPYTGWDELDDGAIEFVAKALDEAYGMTPPPLLRPQLSTSFLRSTLVDEVHRERVTVDVELVATSAEKRVVFRPDGAIVEAKSDWAAPRATRGLQRLGFRAMPMSKYCMALSCADPDLPGNDWARAVRWFRPEVLVTT